MKKASIVLLFCLFIVLSFTANAQSNCTYTLNPTLLRVPYTGGSYSLNITTQQGCPWTAEDYSFSYSNRPTILTFNSPTSGTGSGTVNFTIAQALTTSSRAGKIGLRENLVLGLEIGQDGNCGELFANPLNVNVPREGAAVGFNFFSNSPSCTIATQINVPWITPGGTGGFSGGNYSVAPNPGAARTGTVTIASKIFGSDFIQKTATFTVNQAGQSNCTYTLNPTSTDIVSNGGDRSFTVTTQEGCSWTAISNQSWITITSGSSGIGSGTVNFRVGMNSSSNERGANITVNNQVFLVIQWGYCLLGVEQRTVSAPSSGGSGSIRAVPAAGSCAFSYSSNDSWIISRGSGSGIDYILYRVEANTGAARTGTITVNVSSGDVITITINQAAGQTNCTYSINPTSIQAGAAGGDTGFNITTETGCNWTAQSTASWITVSNTTGSGAGRINYSIQSNTGAARQGTITAGGQTFTINQDGVSTPVELIRASGRVIDANFKSVRGAIISFTNLATGETRTTTTNQFGYFHFANIERGQAYGIAISHKRYKFTTRTVIYNTGGLIPIYNPDPEP
jgi:hypothetical protein